jgi:hypothetical protein
MEVTGDIDLKYCLRLIAKASIIITTVRIVRSDIIFLAHWLHLARKMGLSDKVVERPHLSAGCHRPASTGRGSPSGRGTRIHSGNRRGANESFESNVYCTYKRA